MILFLLSSPTLLLSTLSNDFSGFHKRLLTFFWRWYIIDCCGWQKSSEWTMILSELLLDHILSYQYHIFLFQLFSFKGLSDLSFAGLSFRFLGLQLIRLLHQCIFTSTIYSYIVSIFGNYNGLHALSFYKLCLSPIWSASFSSSCCWFKFWNL